MKFRYLLVALAILTCLGVAQAQQEEPTANPTVVVVKGRKVSPPDGMAAYGYQPTS